MAAYNTATALALCFLATYSVHSTVIPSFDADDAVIGTMARPMTLPGVLDSPTSVFHKDGFHVSPSSTLYSVTPVTGGYQVVIRFLSCSDEGHYVLGGRRFYIIAKPHSGVYHRYTSETHGSVDKIYVLPADRNNPYVWRVVWNTTMDLNNRPTDCCPKTGTAVTGCRMCIYKHIGPANATCSETTEKDISGTQCMYIDSQSFLKIHQGVSNE